MPLQIDATTRYATGNYTKPLTDVAAQLQLALQHARSTRACPRRRSTTPGSRRSRPPPIPRTHELSVLRGKPCAATAERVRVQLLSSSWRCAKYQSARANARRRSPTHCCSRSGESSRVDCDAPGSASSAGRSRTAARRRCRTPALAAVGLAGWRYQLLPVPPELFAETVPALPRGRLSRRQRDDPAQAGRAGARRRGRRHGRARSAPPTR